MSQKGLKCLPIWNYLLDKPVVRREFLAANPIVVLPADVWSLHIAIKRATRHQEEMIPEQVQEQVISRFLGQGAALPNFFQAAKLSPGDMPAAKATLARLFRIVEAAKTSVEQGRSAAAWSRLVHAPMLELAFEKSRITGHRRADDASGHDTVGFVLAAEVSDPKLKAAIRNTVLDMGVCGLGTHLNQTDYTPLRYSPAALGIWVAAWHKRMWQVRGFRHQTAKLTADEREQLIAGTKPAVSVPLIVVTAHEWEVYFACDDAAHITMYGPLSLGSTKDLLGAYARLASLEAIGEWIRTTFCERMKTWILYDQK
ncbi:hypothetical protein F5Y14DRAFT_455917 [Nemania sp. NC0429]|nr:hypothetical protein F5Y14DRAFT_455917 [Nemania sp. NC0429]